MAVEYVKTGSWNRDAENYSQLASTAMPILYSALSIDAVPEFTDRAKWIKVEDQGQQGSCAGQAITTCSEISRVLAGGKLIQLSRQGAYIMAQKKDGINGDRGSTISGNVYVATEQGHVLESVWPYSSSYSAQVPEEYADATKHKMAGHSPMRSFDDAVKHIGLLGTIDVGVNWTAELDRMVANNNGLITSWPTGRGGGHSVVLPDLCILDFDGNPLPGDDPWIKLTNSWSLRWGRKGHAMLNRRAMEGMINMRDNVVEGIFGCASPEIEFQGS